MIGQLTIPGIPPKPKESLSQWFTKPELARRIVRWVNLRPGMRVLEPSAGAGAFVAPLLDYHGVTVEALEIDPEWAHKLTDDHRHVRDLTVHNVDFLQWSPKVKFNLGIMNPPYEGGQDLGHVVHALDLCERVVALVRLNFLASEERYDAIWKRVVLRRQINFIDRPRFSGAGSPRHDFCVVDMHKPPVRPETPSSVATEWWYANR